MNFYLIGNGKIAPRHRDALNKLGHTLSGVCDIDPSREIEGIPFYTDIDSMLKTSDPGDYLIVCTPNGLHFEHSEKALEYGMNCICEKPLTISHPKAIDICWKFRLNGLKLLPVMQNRFNIYVQDIRKMYLNGELGKLQNLGICQLWERKENYYSDWHGTDLDGGGLFTHGIHYIDMCLYIAGLDHPTALSYAEGRIPVNYRVDYAEIRNLKHDIETEDTASFVLDCEFRDHFKLSMYYTAAFEGHYGTTITMQFEKGSYILGGRAGEKVLHWTGECPEAEQSFNDYGEYTGSLMTHDKLYEAWFNGGGTASAEEAAFSVGVLDRVYRKCRKNFRKSRVRR